MISAELPQTPSMTAAVNRRRRRSRRGERGFSLIELGIVIAVIAVLATVVLLGRGFIQSSRVGKANEAVGTVKKAAATLAGVTGGTFAPDGVNVTTDRLIDLQARQLVPGSGGADWVVTGEFKIVNVHTETVGSENKVLVDVAVPAGTAADLYNSSLNDPNMIKTAGATVASQACSTSAPAATATSVKLCFQL